MTISIPTRTRTKSRAALLGAAFALGLGTVLWGPAPADARSEFKNGFEHELGRIVAHHIAAIGHAAIAPTVVVHQRVHYERPARTHYRRDRHHRYHDRHRRHRGGDRHGYRGRGYRHHRGGSHAYGHSRVTVIEKHYRGDRGHRSKRYDRRSRYDH